VYKSKVLSGVDLAREPCRFTESVSRTIFHSKRKHLGADAKRSLPKLYKIV